MFQETENLEQRKNAHKLKGNQNFRIKGRLLLCGSHLAKNRNWPEYHLESIVKEIVKSVEGRKEVD